VAVSPQLEEINKRMKEGRNLSFDILRDPGNQTTSKFGIVFTLPDYLKTLYIDFLKNNLPETNGDDSWTLPMPARYIIDQEGIIRHADINPDYKDRPEPAETLAALKAL